MAEKVKAGSFVDPQGYKAGRRTLLGALPRDPRKGTQGGGRTQVSAAVNSDCRRTKPESPCHAILGSMPQENPFQDPLRFERRVPECAMVIFGANGDLTKRKLMPALYRLAYDRRLSAGFAVIGISRTPMTDDQFREKMLEAVKKFSEDTEFDDDVWKTFAAGSVLRGRRHRRSRRSIQMLAAKLKEVEAAAPHRRQRALLSFHAAQPVRARRARHRRGGHG